MVYYIVDLSFVVTLGFPMVKIVSSACHDGKVCHVSFRRFDNSMGNQKQVSSAAHSQQNVTGKSEGTRKKSLIFATGLDGPLTSLSYPSLMSAVI